MAFNQVPSFKFVKSARRQYICDDCGAVISKGKSRYIIPKSLLSYCVKCREKR